MSNTQGYPGQGPAGPAPAAGPALGLMMKRRNPVAVLLLPLITLGIYGLVWYYKIQKEMGEFDPRRPLSPGTSLLAVTLGIFLIIPPYVSLYNTGKRIAEAQRVAGLPPTCSAWLGLLLGFVGFFGLYYQIELNKVVDHYGRPPEGSQVRLAV